MDERNQYEEDLRASCEGLGVEVLQLEEQLAAATLRAEEAERDLGRVQDLRVVLLSENGRLYGALDQNRAVLREQGSLLAADMADAALASVPLTAAEVERVQGLEGQCVRWEAMYEGMMAERDGYWQERDTLGQANRALRGEAERLREALRLVANWEFDIRGDCVLAAQSTAREALAPKADTGGER